MRKRMLAAAVVALFAAGCGGRKDVQPPLSPKAFATAADRICERSKTRGSRLARLRALHPPASVAELYGHWLTAEQDALAATRPRAKRASDTNLDPALALTIAEGKIAGYARRLGAARCATLAVGTIPP